MGATPGPAAAMLFLPIHITKANSSATAPSETTLRERLR
jgi:hypothetical protein